LYKIFETVLGIDKFYIWIDGPRHDQTEDTLHNSYDYLCTSGGHPRPKQSELDKYIWLLDGWREAETIAAAQVNADFAAIADRVYWLCGGSMRLMLKAVLNSNAVMTVLQQSVASITKEDVKLFLTPYLKRKNRRDNGFLAYHVYEAAPIVGYARAYNAIG
jgi:hypothetical protein